MALLLPRRDSLLGYVPVYVLLSCLLTFASEPHDGTFLDFIRIYIAKFSNIHPIPATPGPWHLGLPTCTSSNSLIFLQDNMPTVHTAHNMASSSTRPFPRPKA